MSHKIALPKGYRLKDGKLVKVAAYRDASHAIRSKRSKKVKVTRKGAV